jgi:predicted Zn finger-like uncharacterized protein
MIIHCTECDTRYTVSDDAIGQDGRTVRCANCGNSWFQKSPEAHHHKVIELSIEEPVFPFIAPSSSNLNKSNSIDEVKIAVTTNKYYPPLWLKLICGVLLPLVIITTPFAYRKSVLHSHPELSFLFEPFGIYYTDKIALADVSVNTTQLVGNKQHMVIDCNVINESKGSRTVPQLRVTVFGADDDRMVDRTDLVETGKNMISGASLPCKSFVMDTKKDEVDRIRFDLVDPFDLSLRKQ